MYERFYNLKRNPFEITPDPSFLFATRTHNEALAALYYGVWRRKGFVLLTGEVGTGKTLLVRCLLHVLNRNRVAYAYVFNPCLSPVEFLQYIAGDLRLPTAGKSKSELLLDLSRYLIARHQENLTTVVVVDEAHQLSADVLEEIRLLTNLETPQEKLLQILLVGQPELDDKLDSSDLRQLKQRIATRAHLDALDLDETRGYVYRRLQLAGNTAPSEVFPLEAIVGLHGYSRGFPRLINTLCENALIHGYAKQVHSINPEIIQEISASFRLDVVRPSQREEAAQKKHAAELKEAAAKALLQLYAHLCDAQASTPDLSMAGAGDKYEPYF